MLSYGGCMELEQQLRSAGVVATWHWSDFEEMPIDQGQRRSLSKMVGGAKSSLESNPIPARSTKRAQTILVCNTLCSYCL